MLRLHVTVRHSRRPQFPSDTWLLQSERSCFAPLSLPARAGLIASPTFPATQRKTARMARVETKTNQVPSLNEFDSTLGRSSPKLQTERRVRSAQRFRSE